MPDAPEFTKCIAAKKKTPVPKGTPKPKDADLKKQCQQEYDALASQVMQFLISAEWIQQEADARGIKTTDKEVQKEFEDQKKQSFPKEKDYQEFLKTSGQTEDDLLFRVKLDVLSQPGPQEDRRGQGQGLRQGDHRLLQQEQVALRDARDA